MAKIKPLLRQVGQIQDILQTTDWLVGIIKAPYILKDHPYWSDKPQNSPYIFSFMTNSISLPNLQIQTQEINLNGYRVRIPLEAQYSGELSITLFEDQNVRSIIAVREWFQAIHDYRRQRRVSSESARQNAYKANIDISLHTHAAKISPVNRSQPNPDVNVKVPLTFKMYGVFPTGMNLPELNSQKTGEPFMLNMTFSYDYFEIKTEKL